MAAFTAEVDGPRAAALTSWSGYRTLFGKTVRWAMGPEQSEKAVLKVRRTGHELVVTAEIDPSEVDRVGPAAVTLLPGSGSGARAQAPMRLEADGQLVARFPLAGSDSWHPVVTLGADVLKGAPVALPYAPEFEPRPAQAGRAEL
ncbi:MAG: hypothetical protein ACK4N5_21965, partial [Myxococcales bacterium]